MDSIRLNQRTERSGAKRADRMIPLPSKIIDNAVASRVYPAFLRYAILHKIVVPVCKAVECFLHHAAHRLPYTSSTEFILKLCSRTLTLTVTGACLHKCYILSDRYTQTGLQPSRLTEQKYSRCLAGSY